VAVAGYFFEGANFIHNKNSGAKISLFGYCLDILCMEHFRLGGAIVGLTLVFGGL